MKVFKKIINKIDSAVMSPRLQRMLPGALEIAERIANTSTHSAKRYSRLLASEIAESAIRGIGPGALIGAGYGLISDEESVIGGALKGAMTGAALAGGYATYRARAMLSSAGARSVGGVSPKAIKRSVEKRIADKAPEYITIYPPPREAAEQAAEQATKQAAEQATKQAAKASTDAKMERFRERIKVGELLKPYRDPETGRLTQEYFDELYHMFNGKIPKSVIKAHREAGIEIPSQYIDVRMERFREKARVGELLKPYRDPETGRLTQGYFNELFNLYNGNIPESVIKAHKEVGIEIPSQYIHAGS